MQNSKIFVLTGGTSGLGLAAVRQLADDRRNHIIVGARQPERAEALFPLRHAGRVAIEALDTSSLQSVRGFVEAVQRRLSPAQTISGLACNAGLQIYGDKRSPDGFDLTFATNHLGHFLLVHGLQPRLAPGAAIVSTASGTHDPNEPGAKRFGFRGGLFPSAREVAAGRLSASTDAAQIGRDRYATSKLCNILFTLEMARRVPAATARFIALDPGLMPGTRLAREYSGPAQFAWSHILPIIGPALPGVSSARRSGRTLALLLSDPSIAQGTGLHFDYRLRQTEVWDQARRKDWAADLYKLSAELCGLDPSALIGAAA